MGVEQRGAEWQPPEPQLSGRRGRGPLGALPSSPSTSQYLQAETKIDCSSRGLETPMEPNFKNEKIPG